ncbi:MAG: N-acetylmuramoyl-L-alanine amidase [Elusimicrobiota bacterium]
MIARLLLVTALGGLAAWSSAEEIQIVKSGKYYGTIDAYRAGDEFYLGAKEAARVYGARLYWYAVREEVRLSFRGKLARFTAGSKQAIVGDTRVEMPRPMIVRASRAFIPIELFTTRHFSDLAGVDSRFNATTRLLLVDQRSSVGPLRWSTHADHTRVVLELGDGLRYRTSRRGKSGFDIDIPNGTIDWSERVDVTDGVVDYIRLYQESKQARLSLELQEGADGWRVREFKEPRRIVIDVARAEAEGGAVQAREGGLDVEAPDGPGLRESREGERGSGTAAVAEAPPAGGDPEGIRDGQAAAESPPRAADGSSRGVYRIAIDAGHGGKDGGTVGRRGTLEKDINLATARELSRLLEVEKIFEILLIRTGDNFVRLGERSKKANEFKADLFISLHCNASTSRAESGFEIYFLSERASDPEAERLAEFENSVLALEGEDALEDETAGLLYALAKTEFINDAAELAGLMARAWAKRVDMPNRGVKQADFYVLRGANSPAVLVETGFLSNARDEAKLQSKKYRRKIVEGLYAGILEFAQRKGWRGGVAR